MLAVFVKELSNGNPEAVTDSDQCGNGRGIAFVKHGAKGRIGDTAFLCQPVYRPSSDITKCMNTADDLVFLHGCASNESDAVILPAVTKNR